MKRLLIAALLTFGPLMVRAQQTDPAQPDSSNEINRRFDEQQSKIQSLEQKDAQNQAEIEKLKQENSERKAKLEALEAEVAEVRDDQEFGEAGAGEEYKGNIFSIWGFFDLTFNKFFYEEDSPYNIYLNPNTTFLMTNINLYFKSQMTQTLSAILELRFSYLPQGSDVSYEYSNIPGTEYQYVDSEIYDPLTTALSRSGSRYVERIHLNYSPVEWFNVIAGRYLTP